MFSDLQRTIACRKELEEITKEFLSIGMKREEKDFDSFMNTNQELSERILKMSEEEGFSFCQLELAFLLNSVFILERLEEDIIKNSPDNN
jgi:hypothetical protein